MARGFPPRPIEERFWEKVDKDGPVPVGTLAEGNCWDWIPAVEGGGYGMFNLSSTPPKMRVAHKVAWELENGPVPEGLVLDHICRRPMCVRPSHLRPVTHSQNGQNQPAESGRGRSKVRGIYWEEARQRWRAQVVVNRKTHSGPLRKTLDEAKADLIELRLKLHTHNDVDRGLGGQ